MDDNEPTVADRCERCLNVLGLEPDATLEQLKEGHRDNARAWHPDKWPGDPDSRARAESRMKAVNSAHDYLQEHWEEWRRHRGSRDASSSHRDPRPGGASSEEMHGRRHAWACVSCGRHFVTHSFLQIKCDACTREEKNSEETHARASAERQRAREAQERAGREEARERRDAAEQEEQERRERQFVCSYCRRSYSRNQMDVTVFRPRCVACTPRLEAVQKASMRIAGFAFLIAAVVGWVVVKLWVEPAGSPMVIAVVASCILGVFFGLCVAVMVLLLALGIGVYRLIQELRGESPLAGGVSAMHVVYAVMMVIVSGLLGYIVVPMVVGVIRQSHSVTAERAMPRPGTLEPAETPVVKAPPPALEMTRDRIGTENDRAEEGASDTGGDVVPIPLTDPDGADPDGSDANVQHTSAEGVRPEPVSVEVRQETSTGVGSAQPAVADATSSVGLEAQAAAQDPPTREVSPALPTPEPAEDASADLAGEWRAEIRGKGYKNLLELTLGEGVDGVWFGDLHMKDQLSDWKTPLSALEIRGGAIRFHVETYLPELHKSFSWFIRCEIHNRHLAICNGRSLSGGYDFDPFVLRRKD